MIMKNQQKNGQYQLKEAQIKQLIGGADTPRDRVIMELLYYCGLRRAEVCSLMIRDLNLDNCQVTVIGKGKKRRLVPMPQHTAQDIRFYLGLHHPRRSRPVYLFPAKKKPRAHLNPLAINYAVQKASERAKVRNPNPRYKWVTPHLLRHSAARRCKDKGLPLEVIKEFLGHTHIKTTAEHYGLLSTDEILSKVKEAMN